MDDKPHFAAALAEAARTINRPQSVEETLAAIAHSARANIPGIDEAGISLVHADGRVETMAATGDLVHRLDGLQYDLSEGPCVSSLSEEPVIVVGPLRHSQRWPRYVPQAVANGLRSQIALRLYVDDDGTLGGLNLYSTTQEDIAPDAPQIAELFAAQAAVALGHAQETHHLNEALLTRQLIGQAVGILIERYGLDEQGAFAFLTRLSSHSNTKIRVIAAQLVEEAVAAREPTA
jgi:hypothetical protein